MRVGRRGSAVVGLLLGVSAWASPIAAQRVLGTVQGAGPDALLGGILVVAKNADGIEVARAVTAEDGRFVLPLSQPGALRVELLRSGYVPQEIANQTFAAGESVTLTPRLGTTLVQLPVRSPRPTSSCQATSGADAEYTQLLREEVRKSLVALQVGLARPGASARWAVTNHRLSANLRDTTRFLIARKNGALLSAFGTPALAEIQRNGYVINAGGEKLFRGLDVSVMLSPWFSDSYCFTSGANSGTGGFSIRFEPKSRRRDFVDVVGEFTLARGSMELLSVSYQYVGLSADEDQRGAGGRINFARTDRGTWLVRDWEIRFPELGQLELETFRAQNQARLLRTEVLGFEVLSGHTTALLEGGTRRLFVNEPPALVNGDVDAVRRLCPERVLPSGSSVAMGKLTIEDGRPVSGSSIRATWRTPKDVGGEQPLWREETRETLSNNRGDWVLCDLPRDQQVQFSWEVQGRRTAVTLQVPRDTVLTVGPDGKLIGN